LSRSEGRTDRDKKKNIGGAPRVEQHALRNAADNISSAASKQPGVGHQLRTVEPALGLIRHRSLTVGAQPLAEIATIAKPPPSVEREGHVSPAEEPHGE
jgi:hypothetical protein